MERKHIRIEMINQGLKGVDVCRMTGIPDHILSRILTGRINPTEQERVLIAGALKKQVSELFGEQPC